MVLNFLKKQFIDVIEWNEDGDDVLAFRFPMRDQEIQTGGQLTVRETQAALFVDKGKVADLFGPGLHTLRTDNLPILTNLRNWDKAFASPFKSDVYFFSLRPRLDRKWGTPQPITVRDREYGPIRVRAFANFTCVVADPAKFFQKVSGTRETFSMEDLEGQLRAVITTNFASAFANLGLAFVDMAASQLDFSKQLLTAIQPAVADFGIALTGFNIQGVSLPEELQARFDRAAGGRIVGDLDEYAKFQTAESIPTAAANQGGIAGVAAQAATGVAIGQAVMAGMGNAGQGSAGKSEEAIKQIELLHDLLKKGMLTQAEFDAKKVELLKKIR